MKRYPGCIPLIILVTVIIGLIFLNAYYVATPPTTQWHNPTSK